ncbi:S41 family peptidase [Nitrospirillum amazonense]|uniref:S41 family peptidase n=1 Tax=Nitrospirillum amazonense TaxID=28077 RepID=UPI002DD433BC|nr:S41 family peptidase [Nitrospirillum amazonense]MEC4592484.1 S41 family peptidase [Nitrospirillum amazonense]
MRPSRLLLSLLLAGALAGLSTAQADEPPRYAPLPLTPAQAQADVALLRQALETIHPGLYRYSGPAGIDAAFARLEQIATALATDLTLWRAVAEMLAAIHCDHTKPEASPAIEAWRTAHATHLPFRFTVVEGRMIVVSNDGQPGAPPAGAEITALNGMPVPRILDTLAAAVAYDGATTPSMATKLADDSDLMGDDVDEYWPAYYGFPDRWQVDWKRPGDTGLSRSDLAPLTFPAWRALAGPAAPFRTELHTGLTWRLRPRYAYLRIDTFVNYRNPVDAPALLSAFFKPLKAREVPRLVLDLRNNGGGSDDAVLALGSLLLARPYTWSHPPLLKSIRYGTLPDHMESWGDPRALFEPPTEAFRQTADGWWERKPVADDPDDDGFRRQVPSPIRYAGRLVVLAGPRNASGATRLLAQLKDKSDALIVGEDSGGSAEGPTAGHIFLLTLPNSHLKVRIPNAWNRTDLDRPAGGPGLGVAADLVVTPTVLDLASGTDRALAVALQAEPGPDAMPDAGALGAALAGGWSGTLDYRDYGTDRRVVLPTQMSATGGTSPGTVTTLAFTFDDGPGKTVQARETWSLDTARRAWCLTSGETSRCHRVVEFRAGPGPGDVTLVADGTGEENGEAVASRLILARRGDTLSFSTLTAPPGHPLLMRHAYWLNRVPST